MTDLPGLLFAALTVTITAGICGMLAPKGALSRTVQYAISLAVAAVLLIPVGSGLGELSAAAFSLGDAVSETGSTGEAARAETVLVSRATEAVENAVSTLLEQRFGIPPADAEVTLRVDASDPGAVRILGVAVRLLLPRDAYLAGDVERYLENQVSAPVTVTAEEDRLWES